MKNFYCQKKCGEIDFSIDEWNKLYKKCISLGLSDNEISDVLNEGICTEQCITCACIVGEHQKRTKELLKNINYGTKR